MTYSKGMVLKYVGDIPIAGVNHNDVPLMQVDYINENGNFPIAVTYLNKPLITIPDCRVFWEDTYSYRAEFEIIEFSFIRYKVKKLTV